MFPRDSSQRRMRQSVTMAIVKEEEEEEEEEEWAQNSFVWRVSLTGFDDDKGCCRGKQHQSVKILRELGTPEDQVALTYSFFSPSPSSTNLLLLTYPQQHLPVCLCLLTHTQTLTHQPKLPATPSLQVSCRPRDERQRSA